MPVVEESRDYISVGKTKPPKQNMRLKELRTVLSVFKGNQHVLKTVENEPAKIFKTMKLLVLWVYTYSRMAILLC